MAGAKLDTPFTSGKLGKMSGGGSGSKVSKAPKKMKSGK
jgi:hypothetical protein